jgi:sugar lactone lactonase YvrE
MYNKCIQLFVILLLFTGSGLLYTVEVKKKEIREFNDFQQGEFKGTSLDSKGRLFIGPRLKVIGGPGREYYLGLDTAANGDIYIGTGHKASVFKINPSAPVNPETGEKKGAVEEIFTSEDLDVYAVVVKDNGDVFAATSPDGRVYKIARNAKDKKGTEFFNPGEKFIWDMKEDLAGNLVLAVGNAGGVYRVDKSGSGSKIFTPEDTHIISLYITRSNAILAGSGDRGIIYRIDDRKARVIFDSPFEEIRGICEDRDGNIYFSATKGIYNQDVLKNARVESLVTRKKKEKEIKVRETSILYRLNTGGVVEKVWTSQSEYIYSLYYDRKNDSVIIGTGNSGRVYRVNKDNSYSIVYESDSAQVYKITGKGSGSGFTLVTNNTASIANIEDSLNSSGTYLSAVYDLQIQSKLGRLYWEANTPAQTDIRLFVRTGNSNVPDNTWTQWSAPYTDKENSTIGIPDTRYFQLKAVLNSGTTAQSPRLESVKVYYIQSNLKPQLKKVEVTKSKGRLVKTKNGYKHEKKPNRLNVRWTAEDLNKDKLKYNIYIKKYNSGNWILIKEDTPEDKMELDTQLYEDGKYLIRVTADDELANPPATARSHSMESLPFLIDSTAPVVSAFSVSGKRVTFSVTDQTSIVARVLYSFDGELWYPVFPVDLLNDSKTETFDFNLNSLPGKKFIFLKVMDEFDNWKVFQEEF